MKRIGICLIVVASISLSVPAYCQPNLEQCIELAYQNYPQIQEYDLIEASRGYDISNASTAWAPQLNISGKASWQSKVVEMPFDIPGMQFDIPHDQYGVTADLTQQIWDGGATSIKKKIINASAEVKKNQLEVNLYAIKSRVQNIYLGINLLDRQIELNDILCESLERTMKEIESLIENGVAYSSDKDQLKVNILACEQQRIALETDRKAYVKMLSLLTGSNLENAEFTEPNANQIGISMEIDRPELSLYDSQAKQFDLQKRQLNANLSPRLNLNIQAGYGRPGLNMLLGEFDSYLVAGVKLQWNLGSFYTLKNDRKKIQADETRNELSRKSFLMNTTLEAMEKQSAVEKAADVLSRDKDIIDLREEILKSAAIQYQEGIIKMNDYLSILDDTFNAKLNNNIHAIQYIMAVYDLQNTTGTAK